MYSGNFNQAGVHTGTLVGTLPAPYSSVTATQTFLITVVDPCLSAVITTSTVPFATLSVYDPLATFSNFPSFTYTSSIGSTACGAITYIATEAPPSGKSILTTFTLMDASLDF
jgi:hypothetical protein